MRARATLACGLAPLVLLTACGGGSSSAKKYPAQRPAQIGLSLASAKAPLTIGVVVTSTSPDGEGASDFGLAEGVQVARVRFQQGGTALDLEVVDDHGTAQGGKDAVAALVAKHVSGIVYASEGDHLAGALAAAHDSGTCVLLPYAGAIPGDVPGTWLTGPSTTQVAAVIATALPAATPTTVFDVGGLPKAVADAVPNATVRDLTSADGIGKADVATLTAKDHVLVWAGAAGAAAIVIRLQQLGLKAPILLRPSALSSDFSAALATAQQTTGAASVSGRYTTVGLATSGDPRRAAGFAAGLRLAAADTTVMDLAGTAAFGATGATVADARSHDAVVAIARAAAGHPSVAATCAGLRSLQLTAGSGIAGPDLSFARSSAVADTAVQVLQSDDGGHYPVAGTRVPARVVRGGDGLAVTVSGVARALGSRYELDRPIGSGAMGEVWSAIDRETGERAAAKLLHDRFSNDMVITMRFIQERSILVGLDHPHIVRVRDLIVEGTNLAIVMDLVSGPDLRVLLAERGTVDPHTAVTIAVQVLDALAHAHSRSVLHRDVKPDNVLVRDPDAPFVLLSDFSIARLAQDSTVRMSGLLGTADYMAPEVFVSDHVSAAADVYATGVLLYELVAGRTPFGGEGPASNGYVIARRHETVAPPPVAGLPDPLWRALERLLAKDPSARPSAASARDDLSRLLPSLRGAAALPVQAPPSEWTQVSEPADHGSINIGSATPALDPNATYLGAPTAPSAPMPVAAAAPVAPAAPFELDPQGTQLGRSFAPRPVVDTPEVAQAVEEPRSWRKAILITLLVVVVLGAGGFGVTKLLGGGKSKSTTKATADASAPQVNAQPVLNSATGLTVERTATLDAKDKTLSVQVTWESTASGSGPFFESVPAMGKGQPCPTVTWSGLGAAPDTTRGIDASACGWRVDAGAVGAGTSPTATYVLPFDQTGDKAQAAAATYLASVVSTTATALEQLTVSPAYPLQRLSSIRVDLVSTPQQGHAVDVTVSPTWVVGDAGGDGSDRVDVLYSTKAGAVTDLLTHLGGQIVVSSDTCQTAIPVTANRPFARTTGEGCTITARIGALSASTPSFDVRPSGG